MQYDIFFSISQTPVGGSLPSESTMFRNLFEQVGLADELGYGTAWLAESHLSSQTQKSHPNPVIPHWEGEVGLNVDFLQLSHQIFSRTKRIECGSAIMNILCNGGPVAAAERVACFLSLHGLDPEEQRRLNVGFAGGRFDFMNRAYGVGPRNAWEEGAWRAIKGQVFRRSAEIFIRLLQGEALSSDQVASPRLTRAHFRSDEDWEQVRGATGADGFVDIEPFFVFDRPKIVPQDYRKELLQLIIGSHDPETQDYVNSLAPVQVFNLSITRQDVIDNTHRRLGANYHPSGGPWHRSYMPRTTFVFVNEQPGLTQTQRRAAAQEEARTALGAYWKALQGTIDPSRVEKAADNALIGDAEQVAQQIVERFHPDERLMLWFDFFNHDSSQVCANMETFMRDVAPRVTNALGGR